MSKGFATDNLISKKSKKKVISNEPQGRLISWSPWPPANFQTRYPGFPFVLTILIIVIGPVSYTHLTLPTIVCV